MLVLALTIGFVAGLRAMMAPAAIAWAASTGMVPLQGSGLAFLGWRFTPWVLTILAAAELVGDQLPSTPSRMAPAPFIARIGSGGASGAAIVYAMGSPIVGLLLGVIGAILGTVGGARLRGLLAATFGSDRPAALVEDALAIGLCVIVVASL